MQITHYLNKIKKSSEHSFVDSGKKETCAKFQQKILNSMVVGVSQSFQIFRQKTWFLEDDRVLSKLLYGLSYYLVLSNHNKISP